MIMTIEIAILILLISYSNDKKDCNETDYLLTPFASDDREMT